MPPTKPDRPKTIDIPDVPDVPDGTVLEYTRQDSGMDFPTVGLFLGPHDPVTVGEDIDAAWAAKFIKRGFLRPRVQVKPEPEVEPVAPQLSAAAKPTAPPASPAPAGATISVASQADVKPTATAVKPVDQVNGAGVSVPTGKLADDDKTAVDKP